ncbi:MAG: metallophosphoesterase [Candidatus Binatia bacterium]
MHQTSQGKLRVLFQQISEKADILLLCSDLVDSGQLEKATVLAKELAPIKIPLVAVLGNHEYESGPAA